MKAAAAKGGRVGAGPDLTYEMLGTGLVLVVAVAAVGWFILRLRGFSKAHRLSDEKLEAVKVSVQKSLDEEAMTRRLVTGIAESLIPTLQHLNVDVKELNALLNEVRESMQETGATIPDLVGRAEQSSHHLAAAIEELVTLRSLAEGLVVEQRDRLKAIDIALDFLSSRVQELGRDLTVPRPIETQVDMVGHPLSGSPADEPSDLPEGNAEAGQSPPDDGKDRGKPTLSDEASIDSN